MYAAALGWVGGRPDAEDITASAFLELWRRRRAVRVVNGSVLPWLLATTANLARNSTRARRRHSGFLQRLPPMTQARAAEDVALAGAHLFDPRLREALRRLSPRDAALVRLVALDDMTVAGAADALGITVQVAKTRLHRARARLRPLLPDLDPRLAAQTHEGAPT